MYYDAVRRAQAVAAGLATGEKVDLSADMVAEPQLTPLYSDFPLRIGGWAAIGLTAYLEYEARISTRALKARFDNSRHTKFYAELAASHKPDFNSFAALVDFVVQYVQVRLILLSLGRQEGLASVEIYRAFLCANTPCPPTSTQELLNLMILMGDLAAPLIKEAEADMHPLLAAQSRAVFDIVEHFEGQFAAKPEDEHLSLAQQYVEQVVSAIFPLLPLPRPERQIAPRRRPTSIDRSSRFADLLPADFDLPERFAPQPPEMDFDELLEMPVAPLDSPAPPPVVPGTESQHKVDDVLSKLVEAAESTGNQGAPSVDRQQTAVQKLAEELRAILPAANDEQNVLEDPRPDRIQGLTAANPFEEGAIKGLPQGVEDIEAILGGRDADAGGRVYSEILVPPADQTKYRQLKREAAPIIAKLRKLIYPNRAEHMERIRRCTSGPFDPQRMSLFEISDCIRRRHRPVVEHDDSTRRPAVVMVACDASASMNKAQIHMLKVMLTAFAESLKGNRGVKLLAGAYHTGSIGEMVSGPLVRWLYHPQKTPAQSPAGAARAISAMADSGDGVNYDSISLTYMLEEAMSLARGGSCYVINLTDCRWNACSEGRDGTEEMKDFIKAAKELDDLKVHYTIVALGRGGDYEMAGVDKVINVPSAELKKYADVASRIAVYVAESIKERKAYRKTSSRRPG